MSAPRTVLVVGPCRSGTSMVAQVCHRLGWCAATTMAPPIPPAWRSDWEDLDLTLPLLRGARFSVGELREYLSKRWFMARELGFEGRICVKSPLLVWIWDELRSALAPEKPLVIRTFREEDGIARSLQAHPQLAGIDHASLQLRLYRLVTPDLEVGYEWAVGDPAVCVGAIAVALGVEDPVAIQAATALVGRPTEYPLCPQQSQQSQALAPGT